MGGVTVQAIRDLDNVVLTMSSSFMSYQLSQIGLGGLRSLGCLSKMAENLEMKVKMEAPVFVHSHTS